jgi:hypothetical protein
MVGDERYGPAHISLSFVGPMIYHDELAHYYGGAPMGTLDGKVEVE